MSREFDFLQSPVNRARVAWLLITLAWALQMTALSTSGFNSCRTRSLLVQLLTAWHIQLAPHTIGILHTLLRKLAHLTTYAVLTLLLYRTVTGRWLAWRPSIAWRCVAGASLFALIDEFHQLFVPERGASLLDCGIDTTGAVLAMLLLYGRWRLARESGKPLTGLTNPAVRY